MKGVAVLGSTGSIGISTLKVLERHPDRFRVVAITGNSNADLLGRQALLHRPGFVGLVSNHHDSDWRSGESCLVEAATHPDADIVVNAVVGFAGLDATIAALRAGKRVALANKESLVTAGQLVLDAADQGGGELIPVDSEHSAILQCLTGTSQAPRRLILTASGGPFRDWPTERVESATVSDALKHPTWKMGAKISVDSATLVNKALEVIEAHHFFRLGFDKIEVVVHPQSIIHSMVETVDGSVLAQLGFPTMELPILYALTHPDRLPDTGVRAFDPIAAGSLTFEAPRLGAFKSFTLGVAAGRTGGTAPAIFNAANEIAVAAFLAGRIAFGKIPSAIDHTMELCRVAAAESVAAIRAADAEARSIAWEYCNR